MSEVVILFSLLLLLIGFLLVMLYVFNIDLSIDLNREDKAAEPVEDPLTGHKTDAYAHTNTLAPQFALVNSKYTSLDNDFATFSNTFTDLSTNHHALSSDYMLLDSSFSSLSNSHTTLNSDFVELSGNYHAHISAYHPEEG